MLASAGTVPQSSYSPSSEAVGVGERGEMLAHCELGDSPRGAGPLAQHATRAHLSVSILFLLEMEKLGNFLKS